MNNEDIVKLIAENTQRSKSNTHRIDEIAKRQDDLDELVGVVRVLASREQRVEDDVKEIKKDVKTLTGKPAKRWDKLIEALLTAAMGAIVGFVLARLGVS